jgi:AcrR family transcriptional regulator
VVSKESRGTKARAPDAKFQRAPRKKGLRKIPLQERSRERLERILDSGQREFAGVGYEAATMESIAERAETSIGSLYQFFPDKRALFDAVAARYERQAADFLTALITSAPEGMSMEDMVSRYLDAFWTFMQSSEGVRAVWINGRLSRSLLDLSDAMNRESAARVADLLAIHASHLSKSRRESVAMTIVELVGCMLFVAVRKRPPHGKRVIAETKTVLTGYLSRVLEG